MKKILIIFVCIFFNYTIAYGVIGNLPHYTGYVNDYTSTLSKQTIDDLNNQLKDFDKQTSNQIAVAIIDTLNGIPIENYSIELARSWGIGQKDSNNGILLLIAKNDRQLRIEVGYGLEGYLTDLQSKWIINNIIVPKFKEGDFDNGVKEGVQKIMNAVSKAEIIPNASGDNTDDNGLFDTLMPFIVFIFIWILPAFFARNKSIWEGAVIGAFVFGIMLWDIFGAIFGAIFGLIVDIIASNINIKGGSRGGSIGRFSSGGFGSSGSIGRGTSFGGGSFGGGGSSGKW